MILLDLIHNVALLVTLLVVHQLAARHWPQDSVAFRILAGFLFGAVGIIGMMTPIQFAPGVIYDGRSIILSVAGLFGGPFTAVISAGMCAAYRGWLGGAGMSVGIATIVFSSMVGVVFYYWRRRNERIMRISALWGFGLLVHIGMLGCQLFLPEGMGREVLRQYGLPILILYPAVTVLICHIFLTLKDQIRSEQTLKESEARYRTLVENTPVSVFLKDRYSRFVAVNNKIARSFGLQPEEMIGKSDYDLFPEEFAEKYRADDRRIMESGEPIELEEIHYQEGKEIWVNVFKTPVRDERGEVIGLLGIFWDITDKMVAQQQLRQSESLLRIAGKLAHLGGWIVNLSDYRVTWSDEVAAIHEKPAGYSPTVEEGIAFYAPEYRERIEKVFNDCVQEGVPYDEELKIITTTGRRVWVRTIGNAERDESGKIIGVQGAFQDITERKQSEQALQYSHHLMRYIIEHDPSAIAVFDRDLKYIYVSQRFLDEYRVQESDIIGKHHYEVFPDIPERWREIHRKALAGEILSSEEDPFYRVDGSVDWIRWECRPWYEADGSIGGMVLYSEVITKRKQAEEALRQSEEKHRLLFENATEGIFVAQHGKLIYGNVNLEALTGYTIEELMSYPFHEFINPDDRAMVLDRHAKRLKGEECQSVYQFRIIHRDGTTHWVELKTVMITWEGEPATLNFITNITERKKADEALRRSEENYRKLFEDHSAVKLIIDPDTTQILDANKAAINFYGWPRERLKQMKIHDINTLSHDEILVELEKVRKNKNIHFEFRHRLADGDIRDVSVFTSMIQIEEKNLLHSIIHDITEGKRAEEELRKLTRAVEQSPASVVITDLEGAIEYVNPRFTEVTGYTLDEVRGRNPRLLKSDEVPPETYKELWECITSGREWRGELHNKKKDGTFYWERAVISPIHDESGAITHYLSVKEDITNEKQLQSQLLQAQKMESVGRLAGGVAHDFNNMLSVIIGYTQMAKMKLREDDTLYHYLSEILKAARRSSDITQQLLAFARKQAVSPKTLDLNNTISDLLKMLHRLIGEDIRLNWLPSEDLWKVRIDPTQVDQILMNLVINARDAISDIGSITIETSNAVVNESYCANHAGFEIGYYVVLTVSDDGCGMDKAMLDHLFEPFFTTKDVGEGTGLGLPTVYGIVKQNQGFINVYSEPGQGSTFRIYLPRAQSDAGEKMRIDEVKTPRSGTETVLVVEDEAAILNLARVILEEMEYTVLMANSPVEAIRLVEEHEEPIDLLVTDMVMPGMNGKELAKRLVEIQPGMKCIYMSGYTENVIAHHGVLDKGIHFLQKPFSLNALADKVREVLDA